MIDWHQTLRDVLTDVFTASATALAAMGIRWINEHIAAMKVGRLKAVSEIVVKSIEQQLTKPERVVTGKSLAMAEVSKLLPGADPRLMDSAIECAVHEMRTDLQKSGPTTNIQAGGDTVTVKPGPPAEVTIEPSTVLPEPINLAPQRMTDPGFPGGK